MGKSSAVSPPRNTPDARVDRSRLPRPGLARRLGVPQPRGGVDRRDPDRQRHDGDDSLDDPELGALPPQPARPLLLGPQPRRRAPQPRRLPRRLRPPRGGCGGRGVRCRRCLPPAPLPVRRRGRHLRRRGAGALLYLLGPRPPGGGGRRPARAAPGDPRDPVDVAGPGGDHAPQSLGRKTLDSRGDRDRRPHRPLPVLRPGRQAPGGSGVRGEEVLPRRGVPRRVGCGHRGSGSEPPGRGARGGLEARGLVLGREAARHHQRAGGDLQGPARGAHAGASRAKRSPLGAALQRRESRPGRRRHGGKRPGATRARCGRPGFRRHRRQSPGAARRRGRHLLGGAARRARGMVAPVLVAELRAPVEQRRLRRLPRARPHPAPVLRRLLVARPRSGAAGGRTDLPDRGGHPPISVPSSGTGSSR